MLILGLDPGISTGWATFDSPTGVWSWGTWKLGFARPLNELQRRLYALNRPDFAVIEKPVGMGYNAMAGNSQKLGVILRWLGEDTRRYRLVAPTTLKKFATGSGRATKEDMLRAAKKKWPTVSNDHEADALWLCEFGRKSRCGNTEIKL